MSELDVEGMGDQPSSDNLTNWRAPWIHRVILGSIYIMAIAAILALILLSPLLLSAIGRTRNINWPLLGNIGQTYGAASAILSGIALIGIALSLVLQIRQARTDRIRLVRERQTQLLGIVLDNPRVYAPVIGIGMDADSTDDEIRQRFFATMWVNYSRVAYEIGVFTEQMLREEIFSPSFRQEPMRSWWASISPYWTDVRRLSRRDREFVRIASDEYRKTALSSQPTVEQAREKRMPDVSVSSIKQRWKAPTSMAFGVIIGVIIGSGLRRRHL